MIYNTQLFLYAYGILIPTRPVLSTAFPPMGENFIVLTFDPYGRTARFSIDFLEFITYSFESFIVCILLFFFRNISDVTRPLGLISKFIRFCEFYRCNKIAMQDI